MVAPANVVKQFASKSWTGLEAEYICCATWMSSLMDWNPPAAAARVCVIGVTKQNPLVKTYQTSASTGFVLISKGRDSLSVK